MEEFYAENIECRNLEFALTDKSLGPSVLEGKFVRLEPLRSIQADALYQAGLDWALMLGPLRTKEAVDQRIADGLKAEERTAEHRDSRSPPSPVRPEKAENLSLIDFEAHRVDRG